MSDLQMREILSRLDAQEAELTALRATRQRSKLRMPGGRRGRLVAIVIAVLLVAAVPLSIYAANPFTDLTGSVHDPNIDTIYNLGITTGCNPPDLRSVLPDQQRDPRGDGLLPRPHRLLEPPGLHIAPVRWH